tara:strand:+ start:434 stop:1384 length:951 start_codon:yes stop_codon:yes gene_type:complete
MAGYLGTKPAVKGLYTVDEFTSSGGTTYTLSRTPGDKNNMQVSAGGLVQYPSAYSFSGTTLTLSGVPSGQKVLVRHFGDTTLYPTLDDDAVTSAKIAAGAVGTTDIANDAVTGAKLNPALVAGDLIYADGTDTINRLAKGTAAQSLVMNAGATAPEWAEAASGAKIVNYSIFQTNTYSTGSFSATGLDDSIPQVSEVHLCMELAYTPTSATNILLITAFFMGAVSSDGNSCYALFKDSTAGAIASWRDTEGDSAANKLGTHYVYYKEVAGSTTARTYKVGLGGSTGATAYFLGGQSSGRKLGGSSYGNIIIYELAV